MPARALPYAQAAAALMAALAVLAGRFDAARAQPLVFDLSDHLIAISTAFTGTEVVAFGALDEASDVVIVVMSDSQTERRMIAMYLKSIVSVSSSWRSNRRSTPSIPTTSVPRRPGRKTRRSRNLWSSRSPPRR